MTDYIKREDALEQFDYYDLDEYLTPAIRGILMDIPSADVAPVVRCKDCEHWDVSKNEYSICCHAYHNMMMVRSDGMGFCSDGERKDNE